MWLYWGIITVQMLNLGFPFAKHELFTLSAVAGLTGATLRIPSTFFIRLAGGRNTIFLTTVLLVIPAVGTGLALRDPATPLWQFQVLALLSGIGGGNFASSMSNISFFFPKRVQGYALGMNAGLGNFGVTTMQILVPLVMTAGVLRGRSDGAREHERHPHRKDPRRERNLDPERRLRVARAPDPARIRDLVRDEQYPRRARVPQHRQPLAQLRDHPWSCW